MSCTHTARLPIPAGKPHWLEVRGRSRAFDCGMRDMPTSRAQYKRSKGKWCERRGLAQAGGRLAAGGEGALFSGQCRHRVFTARGPSHCPAFTQHRPRLLKRSRCALSSQGAPGSWQRAKGWQEGEGELRRDWKNERPKYTCFSGAGGARGGVRCLPRTPLHLPTALQGTRVCFPPARRANQHL